jgi:hypothetical protein
VFTARTRSIIGACAVLCGLAVPAVANAASVYVSNSSPVVLGGKSCTQPNYSTVQGAIDALKAVSNPTINVCPGTYTEQLTITKALKLSVAGTAGSAKVVLPASPANTETICDKAAAEAGYPPDQDEIAICKAGVVGITGLTVEAKWQGVNCGVSMYGIRVAGGATLKATNVTVAGAGAAPINGCQSGVGIQAGTTRTTPVEVGNLKLKGVTVSEYQKNGITIAGAGSTANIATTTVVGSGATPEIAQNGIQVSEGAQAKIKSVKISGNECDNGTCGPTGLTQSQAAGLLFIGAASGSIVTSSTISNNDIGAYYASESPTQPSSAELLLSKDTFASNRYAGVTLDQGDAALKSDTINGTGNIGLDLLQYEGQTLASESSATGARIEGMSQAAVKVESDKEPGDIPGQFKFTKTTFSGNATVLDNESSNFEVIF